MEPRARNGISDLSSIPRIELVSLFMNRYHELDNEARIAFRTEFARRGLPIPQLGEEPPPHSRAAAIARAPSTEAVPGAGPLDQRTFLSYTLLIYTLTGLVYSWIFLASRLAHRSGIQNPKHRAILTVISLAYVAVEALFLLILGID